MKIFAEINYVLSDEKNQTKKKYFIGTSSNFHKTKHIQKANFRIINQLCLIDMNYC